MTLSDACMLQANQESLEYSEDFINELTNWQLIEFLERVQKNYGEEIE